MKPAEHGEFSFVRDLLTKIEENASSDSVWIHARAAQGALVYNSQQDLSLMLGDKRIISVSAMLVLSAY